MISFDGADSGTNELRRYGFIPVRCQNVCGMFVERLWNVFSLSVLTLRHSVVEKRKNYCTVQCTLTLCHVRIPIFTAILWIYCSVSDIYLWMASVYWRGEEIYISCRQWE